MNHIPAEFEQFNQALEILNEMNPAALAIVGSYGDPNKEPDQLSDLDLIYVFDTNAIRIYVDQFVSKLETIEGLIANYLGVHLQFGHVINIFFRHDPLRWVDIGLMDRHFSDDYLVDLPLSILKGSIRTSGITQYPENQMQFLARKLKKAQLRNDLLYVANCACRYVAWLHVATKIAKPLDTLPDKFLLKNSDDAVRSGIENFCIEKYMSTNLSQIVESVLDDIAQRFPEVEGVP